MMVTTDRRLVELIGRRREWLRSHGVRDVDVYTDEQILVEALAVLQGIMDDIGSPGGTNFIRNLRRIEDGDRVYYFEWDGVHGPARRPDPPSPSRTEMREPNGDG